MPNLLTHKLFFVFCLVQLNLQADIDLLNLKSHWTGMGVSFLYPKHIKILSDKLKNQAGFITTYNSFPTGNTWDLKGKLVLKCKNFNEISPTENDFGLGVFLTKNNPKRSIMDYKYDYASELWGMSREIEGLSMLFNKNNLYVGLFKSEDSKRDDIISKSKICKAYLQKSGNLMLSVKYRNKVLGVYIGEEKEKFEHLCYQFTDIPESIRATKEDTGIDTPKDKEWAEKKGVYRVCPAMGVITMDGKETQMGHEKRFAGVLWVAKTRQDRPAPVPPPAAPPVENIASTQPPTSQNGNGNGSKSQNGNNPRPDIFTQRAEAIYVHNAPIALAALCRLASGGKRSTLAELDATQLVALDTSLSLRMELHAVGTDKYGKDWSKNLHRAVRGRNELYDLDAELGDEAIRQMITAIQKK